MKPALQAKLNLSIFLMEDEKHVSKNLMQPVRHLVEDFLSLFLTDNLCMSWVGLCIILIRCMVREESIDNDGDGSCGENCFYRSIRLNPLCKAKVSQELRTKVLWQQQQQQN